MSRSAPVSTGSPPASAGKGKGWLRRRNIVLLALALATLGCGVEVYRGVSVLAEANEGRKLLYQGMDTLDERRFDVTEDELADARAAFQRGGAKLGSASATLERDPAVWALRRLPFVGSQVDSAAGLVEIAEEAAAIGLEATNAAGDFLEIRSREGTLPEKVMPLFQAMDPRFDAMERSLSKVDSVRERIGGDSLLPPLRSAVEDLDDNRATVAEMIDSYRTARGFVPDFLGFSGPRTYLLLAQNNAELLPGGGLVSVVGTVTLRDGRIEEKQLQDAVQFGFDWMARSGEYVQPPAPLQHYLLKDYTWNLSVSNWSPDFPTAAKDAQRFFELGGGSATGGVIAIDVSTLEALLAVTGPIDVPEYGVTVTSANAFDVIEAHTRVPSKPEADRKEVVALLADTMLERLMRPAPEMWPDLLETLGDMGEQKHLLLYTSDPDEEARIRELGMSGEVRPSDGDFLMLVDASVNSTKLNIVLEETVDIDVKLDARGGAKTTVAIDYFNNLAPWVAGRDEELVGRLMLEGLYGGYLRLFVPLGSSIRSVRDETGEVGLEEKRQESGFTVFGRFFALPRDEKRRLVFEYATAKVVRFDGDGCTYRLRLQKQSGQRTLPVTLRVAAPEGMRRVSASLDGEPIQPAGDEIRLELSQDRDIEFVFERM